MQLGKHRCLITLNVNKLINPRFMLQLENSIKQIIIFLKHFKAFRSSQSYLINELGRGSFFFFS